MTRHILHILLACTVSLSSPTASLVRSSCDLSGATSLTVDVAETGQRVDACCPARAEARSLESSVSDCCHASVFSLFLTAPVPTLLAAHGTAVLVSFHVVTPEQSARVATLRESAARNVSVARSLPLLV